MLFPGMQQSEDDLDDLDDFVFDTVKEEIIGELLKEVKKETKPNWAVFQKDTGRAVLVPLDNIDNISESPDGFRLTTKGGKEYQIKGNLSDITNILKKGT